MQEIIHEKRPKMCKWVKDYAGKSSFSNLVIICDLPFVFILEIIKMTGRGDYPQQNGGFGRKRKFKMSSCICQLKNPTASPLLVINSLRPIDAYMRQ